MKDRKGKQGAAFTLTSISLGLINGLFGAGGGMLAVVLLERFEKLEAKKAHATALIIMLPLTALSVIVYLLRGVLDLSNVLYVALGTLPGSLVGARLLGKVQNVWINRLFCVIMLIAGVRMVF